VCWVLFCCVLVVYCVEVDGSWKLVVGCVLCGVLCGGLYIVCYVSFGIDGSWELWVVLYYPPCGVFRVAYCVKGTLY